MITISAHRLTSLCTAGVWIVAVAHVNAAVNEDEVVVTKELESFHAEPLYCGRGCRVEPDAWIYGTPVVTSLLISLRTKVKSVVIDQFPC